MKNHTIADRGTVSLAFCAPIVLCIIAMISFIAGCNPKNSAKEFTRASGTYSDCSVNFDLNKVCHSYSAQKQDKQQISQKPYDTVFKGKHNDVQVFVADLHEDVREAVVIQQNDISEVVSDTVPAYDDIRPMIDDTEVFIAVSDDNNTANQLTVMDKLGITIADQKVTEKDINAIVLELYDLDANVDFLLTRQKKLKKKINKLQNRKNKKGLPQLEIELAAIEEELAFFQPMLNESLEKLSGIQVVKEDETLTAFHIDRIKADLQKSK